MRLEKIDREALTSTQFQPSNPELLDRAATTLDILLRMSLPWLQ
jgi:hypothetical protein